MQGLGRPIISFENHGIRTVIVGLEVKWSPNWKTFIDFLFDFLRSTLGEQWERDELAKPADQQHPLLHWRASFQAQVQKRVAEKAASWTDLCRIDNTGFTRSYFQLAYDLYLCAHNAQIPDLLLTRLRNPKTFEGALYEAYIIGNLAKSGFKIVFEDEGDSTRSHCELTATHPKTDRKFSVEAKAVASTSSRAGSSIAAPKIRGLLYKALLKQVDYERLVLIDLNRDDSSAEGDVPDWTKQVDAELIQLEDELTIHGAPAPPAHVIVTNRGFLNALDKTQWREIWFARGYKIPTFHSREPISILQLAKNRDKHIEIFWLCKALQNHAFIPETFDAQLPEEAFNVSQTPRLMIGGRYAIQLPDGTDVEGELVEACVVEPEKLAHCIYRLPDGQQHHYTNTLSDDELAIYRRSPSTFFGIKKHVSPTLRDELDCYDFYWESYQAASRESLLKWMSDWPINKEFENLSQHDLAQIYCAQCAQHLWYNVQKAKAKSENARTCLKEGGRHAF